MRKYFTAIVALSTCLLVIGLTVTFNSDQRHRHELLETNNNYVNDDTDAPVDKSDDNPAQNDGLATERAGDKSTPTNKLVDPLLTATIRQTAMEENTTATVLRNQAARQELMKSFCKKPNNRRSVRSTGALRHIIYNKRVGFAYCEIGKVASSAWRGVLKSSVGDESGSRRSDNFRALRSVSTGDRHFKFFFVRHPFDRLVSAYVDKFVRRSDYWGQLAPRIIRRYRTSNSTDPRVAFDEFIRYLASAPLSQPRDDFHWSPQTLLCQPCRTKYDFVGHYETLYEDGQYILHRLGLDERIKFPDVNRKKLQQTAERIRTMFANVTHEQIRRLKLIYRCDFEMLGYDPVI